MSFEKLARLDLNLLVCLHVLLEEGSVTLAAKRLCLSQSAVSKSLNRLREQFDDPLFVRTAHGMKPTPRAMALMPMLEQLLRDIEHLTAPASFVPHTSDRHFRMALVESAYPLFLPQFLGDIFAEGPNIILDTQAWEPNTFDKLINGEIDFGITGKDLNPKDAMMTLMPPKGIVFTELCRDTQCCLVRKGHPILFQHWDEASYLQQRHIQVRCGNDDRWLLDYKLAERGLQRDIAMYVPDFNSAASLCTIPIWFLPPRATLPHTSAPSWIWRCCLCHQHFLLWPTPFSGINIKKKTQGIAGYDKLSPHAAEICLLANCSYYAKALI